MEISNPYEIFTLRVAIVVEHVLVKEYNNTHIKTFDWVSGIESWHLHHKNRLLAYI